MFSDIASYFARAAAHASLRGSSLDRASRDCDVDASDGGFPFRCLLLLRSLCWGRIGVRARVRHVGVTLGRVVDVMQCLYRVLLSSACGEIRNDSNRLRLRNNGAGGSCSYYVYPAPGTKPSLRAGGMQKLKARSTPRSTDMIGTDQCQVVRLTVRVPRIIPH